MNHHTLALSKVVLWLVLCGVVLAETAIAAVDDLAATPQRAAFAADAAWRKALSPVQVEVSIHDLADQPIRGAQVIAYCEDWGLPFPATELPFVTTDANGRASFRIWPGQYRFFAGCGRDYVTSHPGEAHFLSCAEQIAKETRIVLKPDRMVTMTLPSDAREVFAMESSHVPLLPLPFCGASRSRQLMFYTNKRVDLSVLLVRPPEETPGYVLLQKVPSSAQQVAIVLKARELHRLHVRLAEAARVDLQPTLQLGFPSLAMVSSVGTYWVSFPILRDAEVDFSPMLLNYCCTLLGNDGSSYWFQNKSVDLRPGETTDFMMGGIRKVKLLAVSDSTTQGGTDLWLIAPSAKGDFLRFYRERGGKEPSINLELRDESDEVVFSERWLHRSDSLHLRVAQSPSAAAKLRYRIDWDLGPFGPHRLEGKLIDDSTCLRWANLKSDHFDAFFLQHLANRGSEVLRRLERAYDFMYEYVSSPPLKKIKLSTPVNPPSAGQAGGDEILIWLDGFLGWNPRDRVNQWEGCLFHELGHHVLEYSARQGAPFSGMRNETLASLLAFEALGEIGAEDVRIPSDLLPTQWLPQGWYENQWFARFTCGNLRRDAEQLKVFMIRFPLQVYLPKVYGRDIHRRFFRNWVACRKLLEGYREEEAFVITYSFLCGKNLGSLFQYAGEAVTPDRVDEGLGLLSLKRYMEIK